MAQAGRLTTIPRVEPATVERVAYTLAPDDPLRLRVEAACEALEGLAAKIIAELDLAAGDPDLEPSLAGFPTVGVDDREDEGDLEDIGDDEPSLGSISAHNGDQRRWSLSPTTDHEEQCEDEGGACEDEGAVTGDDEAWLGWTEGAQGSGNGNGDFGDREVDRSPVEAY